MGKILALVSLIWALYGGYKGNAVMVGLAIYMLLIARFGVYYD